MILKAEVWNLLAERAPREGEYAVIGSGLTHKSEEILVAIDSASFRHLLMPVSGAAKVEEDLQSDGVQIRLHKLVDAGKERPFVDLRCTKPHLNRLFTEIVEEVLEDIQGSSLSPDLVARKVLDRWRELLHRAGEGRLGYEKLVGLFGELSVLTRMVQMTPAAIDCWQGPLTRRHDFAREKLALEVKATTSRRGRAVHVNGVLQLDESHCDALYLTFLRVEENDSGRSVPDLIEEICDRSGRRLQVMKLLDKVGYAPDDAPHYQRYRFLTLERRTYKVDVSFPRIVPSSFTAGQVPSGVVELVYTIELASEPPFPIEETEEGAVLRRLSGAES